MVYAFISGNHIEELVFLVKRSVSKLLESEGLSGYDVELVARCIDGCRDVFVHVFVVKHSKMGSTYYHVADGYTSWDTVDIEKLPGEKITTVWEGYAIIEILKRLEKMGAWCDMLYDNVIMIDGEHILRINGGVEDFLLKEVFGGRK